MSLTEFAIPPAMRRAILPLLTCIMVISLATSAWAGAVLRVNHALASSGIVELVICGVEGAETITLDRDGNRITPSDADNCDHCSDCLLPLMDGLPDRADPEFPRNLLPVKHGARVAQGAAQTVSHARARGPPAETES